MRALVNDDRRIWQCSLLVFLASAKWSDAALLKIQFPAGDLRPPGTNDVYAFFISSDGGLPTQLQFIAANYTTPLIIPKSMPTSWYNVTVLINDFPLPTRSFFSGPDSPTNLDAKVGSPNETMVSWSAPVNGAVQKYRVQLLTRDSSGNISKGSPMDWQDTSIRITPLIPGGEYAVEVVSLFETLTSEPVRTSFVQFPAVPRNFRKISINESAVAVQWETPEGFVDSYYLVLASLTASNDTLLPAGVLTTSFLNLRPGESYQIAISAVRGNWTSLPVLINATTKPLPPMDIREISGVQDTRTIRIAWTPPLVNNGTANYRVFLNSTDIPPLNTTENQATWNNLLPGSTYAATVESFVLTSDGPVFSKPIRKLLHTGTAFTVNAITTAPELSVETTDPTIRFLSANATSEDNLVANGEITDGQVVFFRDLVGGTRYMIYVKSLRNDVEGILPFEKLTYPLPPVNVSINASLITPESVLLEWTRPTNTRLQGYEVLYNKLDDTSSPQSVNSTSILVPDSGAIRYNLTGLSVGTKYSFQLRSLIEDVHSVETPPLLQCTRPLKPIGVTIKPMSVKLLLQLTRPSNSTKYYRVRLLNLDLKDQPPRTMDIRNDSAVVQVPIPIDYLGANYEVRVSSFTCDLSSELVTTVVNSLPPVVNFNRPPAEVTQTSIKVVYQSTWPIGRSIFTRYAFQISGMPPKYVLPNEVKAQTVEFTDLVPGTKYTIFAWTERGDVQSDRKSLDVQLKPDNITEINATTITSHTIAFQWTPPNGTVTQYEIGYNNTEPIFTNMSAWVFNGLLPFKVYSLYVAAWSGTERSSALTRFYTTMEDKPGRVRFFNLTALRPSQLLARWDKPDLPNGLITGYLLHYKENNASEAWVEFNLTSTAVSHVLPLEPGKSYLLRIAPVNSAGIGSAQDGFVTMPLGAPVLARTAARPIRVASTQNTITLEFNQDYFLASNGDVINYTVIVAEEPMQNLSRNLLGWKEVHDLPIWPPYQAFGFFNPFTGANNTRMLSGVQSGSESGDVQVTIGSDSNCNLQAGRYCNGPLKENTRYFVKIRAFSSMSEETPLFTDTIYTDAIVTEAPANNALGIVLGICIPVILLVILAMSLVLMRKHNWGPFVKRAHKAVGKGTIEDKISITESLSEKSRPVKLKDFAEHVRLMTADSDFKFSEEYEDLKHVGRDQACVAADFPVNRAKNRFTNILPYDHSRVKLKMTDDEEGSDYVNANYMPGFNSPREFIVTQGPLPGTRDDFWRMIWEQNCRAVVMLTRCVEKGREKCDHYWPYDTDAVVYGDVDVTVMNETQTAEWTIREFRVAKDDEPARSVRHFHFTGWPDFGVPERPQTLIKFARAFRERVFTDVKPIVVHCSAGVGRSGTFIALDRLLQQIRISDTVDIFGMVCEMRKERVWMVQTEQQYICIHQCLLCVMEGRENEPGAFDTGMHENPCYEISDDEGIVESGPF